MIRGYKGFESDMSCRGLKYEIGKTYVYRQKILLWNRSISLCERGFHFCRNMADVLSYYDGHDCRYAEVEALGEVIDGEDKSVTDKIRIVRELTKAEVFDAMYAQSGLEFKGLSFSADKIIKARESGKLDDLLPSGTELPVRFANGEWNVLVACRDKDHTYLVTKYLMAEPLAMSNVWTNEGGWPACGMREHANEIYDMLPEDIRKVIVTMHIRQLVHGEVVECDDKAFLLSATNIFGVNFWGPSEDCGDTQIDIFLYPAARIKRRLGASSASWWWLRSRSACANSNFSSVYSGGSYGSSYANSEGGVVVGFCIESRA